MPARNAAAAFRTVCTPTTGKSVLRDFSLAARAVLARPVSMATEFADADADGSVPLVVLGPGTYDIYLNDNVYWKNVPQAVWEYTLGGYQVIKKWLSYREHKILGRPLKTDEARYVTEMSRRIAAILLLQPELDENYRRIKEAAFPG